MRMIHDFRRAAFGALALVVSVGGLTGCSDYLTGPKLTTNPNNPTDIEAVELLFVAAQAGLATQQEGQLARWAGMYTGHASGVGRQQLNYQLHQLNENETTAYFSRTYTGGGLVDLKEVSRVARENGDSIFAGTAFVLEAFTMGTAASLWGDIPYSEAGDPTAFPTPALDPQRDVYGQVLAKLDTATAWMAKTGGLNRGPAGSDIIYGGGTAASIANWTRAANTLKARYWMHLVEREGTPAADSARKYALLGISAADGSQDFRTWHTSTTTDQNIWYQFLDVQRAGDLAPGQRLITIMQTRPAALGIADPRLAVYFNQNTSGQYRGGDENGGGASLSLFGTARRAQGFRQPLITYVETQLILAEASFRLGDEAAARTALNNARRAAGFTAAQDIPGTITGTALRDAIFEEKYVAMFQNIEVWNDWKRNCYPTLAPPSGAPSLMYRLPYGFAERNANPNIPSPVDLYARNWNDANACS
jgi:hypothetical protein